MVSLNGFNAHEVEPNEAFEPLPTGRYVCLISKSEFKPTKAGDGNYHELELDVIDGQFKGRKLWDRLNLDNPNATAVKIARSTLSSIFRAVGVMLPRDSGELHDRPLEVTVRCQKREATDELSNEVRGYACREAAAGQPQQVTGGPPWGGSQVV